MADNDALSSLKSRLQKSGLDDPNTVPRRSRASRTPIDRAPETFMGATVGAKSATDGEEVSRKSDVPPSSINLADEEDEVISGGRKPRRKRAARARATGADMDPTMLSQMMGAMGGIPGVAPNPPPISEETEEKPAAAVPPQETTPVAMPVDSTPEPETKSPALLSQSSGPVSKSPEPAPKSPEAVSKIPDAVLKTPDAVSKTPDAAADSSSPDKISKPPSPAPIPTPAVVDDAALELLQAEASTLKEKLEEATERADNYDALCRKLVSDQDPDVRAMAEYIGGLLGKEEDLEELQEEHETVKKELESVKKELEEQKTAYSELLATANTGERDPATLEEERGEIAKLQDTLISRDEEIDNLKTKLREANETAESRIAAAAVGVSLPEGVTMPAPGEEDEIIAMAERELQLMEDLIKEQETYINDLEKELGTAEKAASPAAVEETKCKDEAEAERGVEKKVEALPK
ncbi:hypothetical protein PSACC_02704 [Paramicrosporidium saccamoebae]|uniref:Uncharacterized protein n=1 Tax=Paramicrosporidium saccamoebae TaxID=1246581 RepID=A0A2H9TIA1_9FUNG|nr:hypothetical protein PSACC_02704 [Paramicrosporidium saccamoebae]